MRRLFNTLGTFGGSGGVFCLLASSAHAISSAVNISTRMVVETGDNVLIGGFIVYGDGPENSGPARPRSLAPGPGCALGSDPRIARRHGRNRRDQR